LNGEDVVVSPLTKYLIDYGSDIKKMLLYSIDFESACTLSGAVSLPCEVGICEFNIEDGEISCYHSMLNPGNIPEMSLETVHWVSSNIHGLYLDDYQNGRDSSLVWTEICQF